jgi:hypothetical protein
MAPQQAGAAQVGAGVQQFGTGPQQLEQVGLQHFGLQNAKKCARLCVQHEGQAAFTSQPALQPMQWPPVLQ